MNRYLIAAAVLAAIATAPSAAPLADRHAAKGIPCQMCHGTAKPEPLAEVDPQACLKCHPRTAIVAKFAKHGPRNPHDNHLGDAACDICHKGHSQSVLYCAQCHKNFTFSIK